MTTYDQWKTESGYSERTPEEENEGRDDLAFIPFTQYLRPDGRQKEVRIARPEAIADKAKRIIESGNRFECEMLTTGDVSLTIANDKDGDLDIEVVPNSAEVPAAVDRLVARFNGILID